MKDSQSHGLKILAVHSYAIHGTASMKAFNSILGSRLLPVPSLVLTGLTNISGFKKTTVAFEDLLLGSLELARQQKQKLLFYVGYLGSPQQAEVILKGIHTYRDCIERVLVDPVSGDHGRVYVPPEIIEVWPSILQVAHWAFPNYTELQLLSGVGPQSGLIPREYLKIFGNRFPSLSVIATSIPDTHNLEIGLLHKGVSEFIPITQLPQNYGGTGDVFAAIFVKKHFMQGLTLNESLHIAATETAKAIQFSIEQNSKELLIYPNTF
ncbi:MAG: hypothetical protein AAF694_04280 [Bacteroidota bacterium]